MKDAFKQLADGTHVKPELEHVAAAGHSMGGAMAASLAASAHADGLPQPKVICSVEPDNKATARIFMPMADLSLVPAGTRVDILVGEDDTLAGQSTAREIFNGLTHVAPADKNLLMLMSDTHGDPPLRATHLAPIAPADLPGLPSIQPSHRRPGSGVDALDYFGPWKLLDALCSAAFENRDQNVALGNTPQQTFMGRWSDGMPVKPMVVITSP